MSNPPQTLKGFRDFLGADARKRAWLKEKIRIAFEKFGFEPLETPTLEYESLLLGKYGAEADKLIYGFEDRGGRRIALRYDQTVPTARIVAQYKSQLVFPYKRYQIQNVWRADKPQKGRFREFTQCDADIIGSTSLITDAEILAIYASIYLEIGITSIKIKINDRQQLIENILNSGITQEQVFTVIQSIDKLDKKTREEVLQELEGKGISMEKGTALLNSLEKCVMSATLKTILDYVKGMGIDTEIFEFTPTLARGLDYYTGLIFEGIIPEYGVGSVGGGGRYDNLIKDLVGVEMPAVGFGLGFDRTLEAAEELGKIPDFKGSSRFLVTVFSPELVDISLEVTSLLRKQGIATECYLESGKRLDGQLKYANAKGIPFVVIIGPDEAEKRIVRIKDMADREEREISIDALSKVFA
jgi:histidyl-tRNA synthetase